MLSSKFSCRKVSSQLSQKRWVSLCYLWFTLYMAHRFSKSRRLQLTCPFLDKNSCQSRNESGQTHRTPSPPKWEIFSKIMLTDIVNDKLFIGQERTLFFKACSKMHLPAVEFLLPSSLGTPALQLAWHLHWHILHTPTGCSSWSESCQWWQTSGWCGLSRGKKPKQLKQPSRQPQSTIPDF